MSFEQAHEAFIHRHARLRTGERLRRRIEGHGHAEQHFLKRIWWPAVGNFDWLHPEYEQSDFKDGVRYLDFAYIRFPYRICIEIDGYGPHLRDVSRSHFADQLMRQNHLVLDGWRIIRLSYDDILEKPRRGQQLIQQCMGKWYGKDQQHASLTGKEHELVRMAIRSPAPIRPAEASSYLGISTRHARTLLQRLVAAKVMVPAAGGDSRIRAYTLNPDGQHLFL